MCENLSRGCADLEDQKVEITEITELESLCKSARFDAMYFHY